MTHLPKVCHAQGYETCWNVHTTTSTPQTGDGLTGKRANANRSCQSRWCRASNDLSVGERPEEVTVQAAQSARWSSTSSESLTKATPRTRVETRRIRTGHAGDYWTLDRIAHLIWDLFEVRYHPSSGWHILNRMGWSCQQPQRQALQRNDEKIAHWRHYLWPQIKKVALLNFKWVECRHGD